MKEMYVLIVLEVRYSSSGCQHCQFLERIFFLAADRHYLTVVFPQGVCVCVCEREREREGEGERE